MSQEARRLADVFCWELRNAEKLSQFLVVHEGESFIGRFAVQSSSPNTVNMRTDEIDIFLSEFIKRSPLGQNITNKGVILLNSSLLVGEVWVAGEEFRLASDITFNVINSSELTTVVCKDNRENLKEVLVCLVTVVLDDLDMFSNYYPKA